MNLRKEYSVFADGRFFMLAEDSEQIFAYVREDEKHRLLVVCNFFEEQADCGLQAEWEGMELVISNYKDAGGEMLRPYEARMYLARK